MFFIEKKYYAVNNSKPCLSWKISCQYRITCNQSNSMMECVYFFHKCSYISALTMTPLTLDASMSVTIYVAELVHIAVAWVLAISFPYLMEKGCSNEILNEDGI